MKSSDIAHHRLRNQHIGAPRFQEPAEVVSWLGAVQAQDYAGAKWALGLRLNGATDDDVERAFTDGAILRTHLLRPTWHFVTPADIRWLLALTASRVNAVNAYTYRKLGLDDRLFTRTNRALVKALQGGKELTRDELRGVLQRANIATEGELRMGYLMMRAELDGLICSGARRGKHFTYALLDERARNVRALTRDEALAELARRYFLSRGPATVQDFARWSGLTATDARIGVEAVKAELRHEVIDGQSYWLSASAPRAKGAAPSAHLLSIYDEYISGYKDRSAISAPRYSERLIAMGNALNAVILVDGLIVGTWQRTFKNGALVVETNPFTKLTAAQKRAVAVAADRLARFLKRSLVLA
jgi:hypothetical protein